MDGNPYLLGSLRVTGWLLYDGFPCGYDITTLGLALGVVVVELPYWLVEVSLAVLLGFSFSFSLYGRGQ